MSPRRVHWKGHTYPSIGWALGDILLAFPLASDQQVAEWLNVTPQTVCHWRKRTGIPEYRLRHPTNPYLLSCRLAKCPHCCRAWRLKAAQWRRKCPGCQRWIELSAIEIREARR